MADWATIIPTAVATGGLGWAGKAALSWLNGRGEQGKARIAVEADMEKHRDGLTFELLGAARTEMVALRSEVAKLRPMEGHLFHLEQALEHLEALLNATADDRKQVERAARAFVNRMRRTADARGTAANEAQIERSRESLPPDMRASLDKLD